LATHSGGTQGRGAERDALSQERRRRPIVGAAREVIASDGFEALTMRRLAERCGVGAMTLYGYVRTKEDLLGALADTYLAEVDLPEGDLPWQEQIAGVFRSVHHVFLAHPELVQIVATQPLEGAAALRGAEVVLAALRRAGLDGQEAVSAFDALVSYTAGFTQRDAAARARAARPGERLVRIRELAAAELSHVTDVAGLLVARDSERRFEGGLDLLIRGVASRADHAEEA
jgi:AcrR family transcriptional regulator